MLNPLNYLKSKHSLNVRIAELEIALLAAKREVKGAQSSASKAAKWCHYLEQACSKRKREQQRMSVETEIYKSSLKEIIKNSNDPVIVSLAKASLEHYKQPETEIGEYAK